MATSNNSLDFRDPGMMSDELLSVPGFINELKNYTIAVSPRPNPPLAFAGALAMLAAPVPETPEAKIKIAELRVGSDEIARRLFESDLKTGAALYCRLYEKAMKLALLYAISENPANPVISAEGVYWAARFATHITQKMLFEAQFNVSKGAFDRLKQRFLNILVKHGGKLDHSTLLKSLRVEASLFKRIVTTLLLCDQIETEELINGKQGYIVKSAA